MERIDLENYWPVGLAQVVEFEDLHLALFDTARLHARRALSTYSSYDFFECIHAAISAGCAIELLAKSYIATVSPALLADRGDEKSLLIFTGNRRRLDLNPVSAKSRGARECLILVSKLLPSIGFSSRQFDEVLDVRNAAIHLGLFDSTALRTAIESMTWVVSEILQHGFNLPNSEFWGDRNLVAVSNILDHATKAASKALEIKLANARETLHLLTTGIEEPQISAIASALSERPPPWNSEYAGRAPCPVCNSEGWISCEIEPHSPLEGDDEGYEAIAIPFAFNCSVCQLGLVYEELRDPRFDLPSSISTGTQIFETPYLEEYE